MNKINIRIALVPAATVFLTFLALKAAEKNWSK
jgi:hypothetical protein